MSYREDLLVYESHCPQSGRTFAVVATVASKGFAEIQSSTPVGSGVEAQSAVRTAARRRARERLKAWYSGLQARNSESSIGAAALCVLIVLGASCCLWNRSVIHQ